MDADHFDSLARFLTSAGSRRRALAALGSLATLGALPVSARKGKKAKKPQKNAFGCVDVGKPCAGKNGTCCSGLCQGTKPKKGKKDRSTCVAHNSGICTPETDSCTTGVGLACNPGNPQCFCTLTTGNAGFCGDFTAEVETLCRVCRKDTDCQAELGPGAACLVLGGIGCTPFCAATGRTACVPPCA